MSKYCPVIDGMVTYMVCQECDEKECKKVNIKKNSENRNSLTENLKENK